MGSVSVSSTLSSRVNRLFRNMLPEMCALLVLFADGGGKYGSTAILKALSSIEGIILDSRGQHSYREGLLLTSSNHTLKLLSIMKSSPKI